MEDLAAVITATGSSASVYGISSGAALALRGAAAGLRIERLALYEILSATETAEQAEQARVLREIETAVAAGRRGHAVRLFLRLVGLPRFVVALMRFLPVWSKLTAVAHTLPYDLTAIGAVDPELLPSSPRWASVRVPSLAVAGSKSPESLRAPTRAVADALPDATFEILPGQDHMVDAAVLAPVLTRLFTARTAPTRT